MLAEEEEVEKLVGESMKMRQIKTGPAVLGKISGPLGRGNSGVSGSTEPETPKKVANHLEESKK